MKYLKEKSYAKINLVLNVLDKREDGFHEVDFLMGTINLHDVIEIKQITTFSGKDIIEVKNQKSLSNKYNLAFRALILIKRKMRIKKNFKIIIRKNIPVSAGMAGGSGNAAAVLRMINKMENLGLTNAQLAEMGAELGSDVPFCIYSQLAHATGRGEHIEVIKEKIPHTYVLVANPGTKLSTRAVYNNHVVEDNIRPNIDELIHVKDYNEFYNSLNNDLEKTAIKTDKNAMTLKNDLEQAFPNHKIMLSGSGPTFLVFAETIEELEPGFKVLKKYYPNTFLTELRS